MTRLTFASFVGALLLGMSCASQPHDASNGLTANNDPFAGFWADPSLCALELKSTDGKNYRGTIWGDLSFPFEGVRDGEVLRGNVLYTPNVKAPLEARGKDGMLLITMDKEEHADHPLKRFKDQAVFEQSSQNQLR